MTGFIPVLFLWLLPTTESPVFPSLAPSGDASWFALNSASPVPYLWITWHSDGSGQDHSDGLGGLEIEFTAGELEVSFAWLEIAEPKCCWWEEVGFNLGMAVPFSLKEPAELEVSFEADCGPEPLGITAVLGDASGERSGQLGGANSSMVVWALPAGEYELRFEEYARWDVFGPGSIPAGSARITARLTQGAGVATDGTTWGLVKSRYRK